ncbi:hypothetical protein BBK36DRAFT_1141514 [Trichoderma citrinoviride]|uniref:DUF1868 domain-containing protein n=1 Tax=Trichoderma citrinoviride TaxID=58853 RepID=A0A2T4B8A4_9HYPO|nr:hypothetical protein BBK36DRAFT_1141514 [Trichoderma citrinoviride]PTB65556.1 hypothetical protein BBK36DRAFT_1141514 [Trichoderma citrinoviride]
MHLHFNYIVAAFIRAISISCGNGFNFRHLPQSIHSKTPKRTGKKFDTNGNVLPSPGITIICHLPQDNQLYKAHLPITPAEPITKVYTLLPLPSWDMTVFEGVCDLRYKPEHLARRSGS